LGIKTKKMGLLQHIISVTESSESLPEIKAYFDRIVLRGKESINYDDSRFYFVEQGCVFLRGTSKEGKAEVIQFGLKQWWFVGCAGEETRDRTLNATEPTVLLTIERTKFEMLMVETPVLERYFRIILLISYRAALKKIELLTCYSPEYRVTMFMKAFPEFAAKINDDILSSFLGASAELINSKR
jgi:CRP-like cAMP-binding protein